MQSRDTDLWQHSQPASGQPDRTDSDIALSASREESHSGRSGQSLTRAPLLLLRWADWPVSAAESYMLSPGGLPSACIRPCMAAGLMLVMRRSMMTFGS